MRAAAMAKTPSGALHGGCFETSPACGFGEVSKAPFQPQMPCNQPIQETGTSVAISYLRLGVVGHIPIRTSRGGARNHANRQSQALTFANIANLKAAVSHASAIGLPFTRMITIHWKAAGVSLKDMAKATGRFIDLLTKWLARNKQRTAWLCVHENGDNKGWHCHLLAHVPAALVFRLTGLQKSWLKLITGRRYKKKVVVSRPIGGRLNLENTNPELYAVNLARAFGYLCKGASQLVLDTHCIDRQHEPGGRIIGKRCGTSQNIGAKARKTKD
jgi:hypothetical protein